MPAVEKLADLMYLSKPFRHIQHNTLLNPERKSSLHSVQQRSLNSHHVTRVCQCCYLTQFVLWAFFYICDCIYYGSGAIVQ